MTEKCFDIGTIQAFLDGELQSDAVQRLTGHIALCDDCAVLLAEAEDETAFAFGALEREFDTLVPTHRLWTKINDSIVVEKKQSSVWQRFLTAVSVYLANPSVTVAAGIFVVFGLFTVFLISQGETASTQLAEVKAPLLIETPTKVSIPSTDFSSDTIASAPLSVAADKENSVARPRVQQAAVREDFRRSNVKSLIIRTDDRNPANSREPNIPPAVVAPAYLPGEESYEKTIANLTQTVSVQKDEVLRPSARVAFERDLAVVSDAIEKMKTEVRRNPKNESAKQVLYSSYQNKIDLLNSVAGRNELMASLK